MKEASAEAAAESEAEQALAERAEGRFDRELRVARALRELERATERMERDQFERALESLERAPAEAAER